jgi:hypothetical protein
MPNGVLNPRQSVEMPNAVRAIVGTRDVLIVAPESSFNIPVVIQHSNRHSTFQSTFDIPFDIRHSTFANSAFGRRQSELESV